MNYGVRELLNRLEGVRPSGSGWVARCPAHADRTASLSVKEGDDGRVLAHCFAGCEYREILASAGVATQAARSDGTTAHRQMVAAYEYTDASGTPIFYRDRYEWTEHGTRHKSFCPRQLNGARRGKPPVPYRLHEVARAIEVDATVIVCEGEKAADALHDNGYTATTTGGARSWEPKFAEHFLGARVLLWPDVDEPGEKYAADVACSLAGVAAEVRVIRFADKPSGWDAADFFGEGGTETELDHRIEDAPSWSAAPAPEGTAPDAPASRPYRLYSAAELDELPPATWIVESAIPQNGIVGVIGAKGTYKTFFLVHLVLCIVTGTPWHGHVVQRGGVVYVYAEGPFGAKARFQAGVTLLNTLLGSSFQLADLPIWFLPSRIPINNPTAVAALLAEIRARPAINGEIGELATDPLAVIIDTVNQNLDGDEDGRGMGGFVAGCCAIRDALGCTVLDAHHTPLGADDRGRGHSSFDGALDTRLIVSRDKERLTVDCTHQRNGLDGWSVAFEAIPTDGSLALKPSALDGGQLNGQRREMLDVVHRLGTATYSVWMTTSEIKPSSFRKARTWLLAKGYVRQEGKYYSATASGADALGHPGRVEGTRA